MSRRRFQHKKNPWEKGPNNNKERKTEHFKNKRTVTESKQQLEVETYINGTQHSSTFITNISNYLNGELDKAIDIYLEPELEPEPEPKPKLKKKKGRGKPGTKNNQVISKIDKIEYKDKRDKKRLKNKYDKERSKIEDSKTLNEWYKDNLFYALEFEENRVYCLIQYLHSSYDIIKKCEIKNKKNLKKFEERCIFIWLHLNEYLKEPIEIMIDVKENIIDNFNLYDKHLNGDFTFFKKYFIENKNTQLEPFQRDILDSAREGKNIIISSKTGTGKTVLTAIISVYYLKKMKQVVFIVPGEEVAFQVLGYINDKLESGYALLLDNNCYILSRNDPKFIIGNAKNVYEYISVNNIKPDCIYIDEIHMMNIYIQMIMNNDYNPHMILLSATLSKGNIKVLSDYIRSKNTRELEIFEYNRFFIIHTHYMIDKEVNVEIKEISPISIIPKKQLVEDNIDFNIPPHQLMKFLKQIYGDNVYIVLNKILNTDKNRTQLPYRIMDMDDIAVMKTRCVKLIKHFYKNDKDELTKVIDCLGDKKIFKIDLDNKKELQDVLVSIFFSLKKQNKLPVLLIVSKTENVYQIFDLTVNGIIDKHNHKFPKWRDDRERDKKELINLKKLLDKNEENIRIAGDKVTVSQVDKSNEYNEKISQLNPNIHSFHEEFQFGRPIPISERRQTNFKQSKSKLNGELSDSKISSKMKFKNRLNIGADVGIGLVEKTMPVASKLLTLKSYDDKYYGVIVGDSSIGTGINIAARTVININYYTSDEKQLQKQVQDNAQFSGRSGRRGLETEGNIINIFDKKYDDCKIPEIYKCKFPDISPILDKLSLTNILKIYCNNITTIKGKKILSEQKIHMFKQIEECLKEDTEEYLDKIKEMLSLDDISLHSHWIFKIGNSFYNIENKIFNDINVLLFYNILDIMNSDLSSKEITKGSHKEIGYFLSIILWLFNDGGETINEDIETLKKHITLSFDIPIGYDKDMFNVVYQRRFGDRLNKDHTRLRLIYINQNIIKNLVDIKYENIKAIALTVYDIILNLTSINNYLDNKK